ncbi:hypothetical protein HWV62_36889 [Athelia sp. TMB]|nr:hypothetical protein HWV62_36889 [Athelia sp. TMB]
MFAAASSFFSRTAISQSYNIGASSSANGSRSGTPTPSGSSVTPVALAPPFNVGPWRIQAASHKVTNKRVSVWSFDKRGGEVERLGAVAKDRVLEVLKGEASALGRLRHPSILEMVEPLEETRSELIFATEPILSSLLLSIPNSSHYRALVELDEVEIQKGILQLCKGLEFMHNSGRIIHSNINPETIIINSAGDWKIAGLGLTIPLTSPDGKPTRWEFPTFDGRVPAYIQRSFDYMAPEYALDEVLVTASDIYSLGALIYAVHCKGNPPFKNHGSLGGLRENAGKYVPGMDNLDPDLQVLLRSMITRGSAQRPTPATLPTHSFFSSLPISTLNFLDRSNFSTKSREEKISFMKGLTSVLDRFSEGLRTRKILPTLVEEMKDVHLLPHILPNVFSIAKSLTPAQFSSMVLPSLKPLFTIKDPPQNMLTLLDNLPTLQSKTEKNVFREQVLPLVYHALESEHAIVQERALKTVPDLCETVDYAEVSNVLFTRVAIVFTKTRILSVKIATLTTFLSMVKTLDQTNLTQKLVPLLSKIRTKEPGVMMATLSVQEAMGFKVDREAVATLVLPQLWAMSMGPLINVEQFQRFMSVIRKLGDRVEKEHNQFLRDSQRIEDRSGAGEAGAFTGAPGVGGGVDFESLVGRANSATVKADSAIESKSWDDDDPWGSILAAAPPTETQTPQVVSPTSTAQPRMQSVPSSPKTFNAAPPARLSARATSSSSFSSTPFAPPPPPSANTVPAMKPLQPQGTGGFSRTGLSSPSLQQQMHKPNYNIALPAITPTPTPPAMAPPMMPSTYGASTPMMSSPPLFASPAMSPPPMFNSNPAMSSPPLFAAPPAMGSMLAPSKPAQQSWNAKKAATTDWGDFDPLA